MMDIFITMRVYNDGRLLIIMLMLSFISVDVLRKLCELGLFGWVENMRQVISFLHNSMIIIFLCLIIIFISS
jgi:hypothetical protein